MITRRAPWFIVFSAATALALGCSDDGEEDGSGSSLSGQQACEEIGETCHDPDTGSGLAAECHELGHVGDGQVCLSRYEECMDFCTTASAAGGAGHGHGSEGGAAHGGGGS